MDFFLRSKMTIVILIGAFFLIGCSSSASYSNATEKITSDKNAEEANDKEAEEEGSEIDRDSVVYYYNADGSIRQIDEKYYSDQTGLLEYTIRKNYGDHPFETKYVYEFNSNKQEVSMHVYDIQDTPERLTSFYTYEYDANGRKVKEYHYGTKRDDALSVKEYDYDGVDDITGLSFKTRGRLYNTYGGGKSIIGFDLILEDRRQTYDKDGNLTDEIIYDEEGYTDSLKKTTTEYERDTTGRIIGLKEYDHNGNLIKYIQSR